MRLISLNTWGVQMTDPLFAFLEKNAGSTDIFCLQEILRGGEGRTKRREVKDAYERICKLLPEHAGLFTGYGDGGYYSEPSSNLDFEYGIASFVRADLAPKLAGSIVLRDPARQWSDYSDRFAAGVAQAVEVGGYAIINVHGVWQGSIKDDTEAKIEQSETILGLAERTVGKKILCGDFNLLPHTKALGMFRDLYNDLVQSYGVQRTRSALYHGKSRHAAYVFTDKRVKTRDFSVPDMEISDHLPLIVEFD